MSSMRKLRFVILYPPCPRSSFINSTKKIKTLNSCICGKVQQKLTTSSSPSLLLLPHRCVSGKEGALYSIPSLLLWQPCSVVLVMESLQPHIILQRRFIGPSGSEPTRTLAL